MPPPCMYWVLPPNPPLSCCHFLLCPPLIFRPPAPPLQVIIVQSLICLLESVGLEQHVNQPTHIRGHALDLIITRKVNEIIRSPPYVDRYFSDHGSVVCSILAKVTATRVRTVTYRKVRSVKLDSLKNSLTSSGLCSINCEELLVPRDPEKLVIQYNSTLSSVIDQHEPLKTQNCEN